MEADSVFTLVSGNAVVEMKRRTKSKKITGGLFGVEEIRLRCGEWSWGVCCVLSSAGVLCLTLVVVVFGLVCLSSAPWLRNAGQLPSSAP